MSKLEEALENAERWGWHSVDENVFEEILKAARALEPTRKALQDLVAELDRIENNPEIHQWPRSPMRKTCIEALDQYNAQEKE